MLAMKANHFFLVADHYLENIYQIDVADGTTSQLLPLFTASRPVAVAYDWKNHVVFWTENTMYPNRTTSIRQYSIFTSELKTVYQDKERYGTFAV